MNTVHELVCPKCGFPTSSLVGVLSTPAVESCSPSDEIEGTCLDCFNWMNPDQRSEEPEPSPSDLVEDDWEYSHPDDSHRCHYCCGEGWGIVGTDWDCDDAINGPYPGEIERCPCCGGSGNAEDCTFW